MRAIIQDISEITDSRELLEAKPHPFLAFFIYLILAIIITALIWSYFGEIEIVVKAQGIVRPDAKLSTIRNKISGKVVNVFFADGQMVQKGDLLYRIEDGNPELEKNAAAQELQKTRSELEGLRILNQCILANKTVEQSRIMFGNDANEYFYRYLEYASNYTKLTNALKQRRETYNSLQKLWEDGAAAREDVKNARESLDSAELDLQIYRNKLLVEIQNNIATDEKAIIALERNLKSSALSIGDSVVTAPIAGVINTVKEINQGDLLQSGEEIITIVPEHNTRYKVQIYVANKDIANIKTGDPIKYHFLALPYREYGELKGRITNIGIDAKPDGANAAAVYLVEADIENKPLYSYKGTKAEIKVGMLCEAQVITKTKKILYFLLEKIDLMD